MDVNEDLKFLRKFTQKKSGGGRVGGVRVGGVRVGCVWVVFCCFFLFFLGGGGVRVDVNEELKFL